VTGSLVVNGIKLENTATKISRDVNGIIITVRKSMTLNVQIIHGVFGIRKQVNVTRVMTFKIKVHATTLTNVSGKERNALKIHVWSIVMLKRNVIKIWQTIARGIEPTCLAFHVMGSVKEHALM
jgi:hypothetical protein